VLNRDESTFTRRQWLLSLGGGVALAGWSGMELEAAASQAASQARSSAALPPGIYEASREHLGHALADRGAFARLPAGSEIEIVRPRSGSYQPAFFTQAQYPVIRRLIGLLLGEPETAAIVDEIAEWIDLTASDSAAVRAAAHALSPAHHTLAIHHFGAQAVRRLEDFDPQKISREGLAWLDAQSQQRRGRTFAALDEPDQLAILENISDDRQGVKTENAGTRFFQCMKERVIHGFYTSRAGLEELGYRGNAFYASPPGCENLYA